MRRTEQTEAGLAVANVTRERPLARFSERYPMHLYHLGVFRRGGGRLEIPREIEMQHFREYPGRG